jgi:hypothetical protein
MGLAPRWSLEVLPSGMTNIWPVALDLPKRAVSGLFLFTGKSAPSDR